MSNSNIDITVQTTPINVYVSTTPDLRVDTQTPGIQGPAGPPGLTGDAQTIRTNITSGVSSQYISFDPVFTGIPYIHSTLETSNGLYVYNLSGVSASGFNVTFSAPVETDGLKLCTLSFTQAPWLGI